MTHWLALDTAAAALADAGFPSGEGLPAAATAVIVGNSLTGEFTRANLMRLRWPYVRRTVGAALREHGWDDGRLAGFLHDLEGRYKSAFPAVDEDTLAGGLSNTIAGRICNQFDFKGGGFTVDGACSSSLLSVATACNALSDGQIDAAVVGGVDLSIDPFEIIGFAKTGALATRDMRVYDKNANGFWPGEGCGMLVLLRQEDAAARGLRSYATIAGWGYSSDGKGGITRPDAGGHQLAIHRAYQAAGFDIGTVAYLEGHGTGTAVGDATELRAFSAARRQAREDAPPAAISTVKGNIGHTKAAAGRRRADQGHPGRASPDHPPGHRPHRRAPGARRPAPGAARAADGGALAGGPARPRGYFLHGLRRDQRARRPREQRRRAAAPAWTRAHITSSAPARIARCCCWTPRARWSSAAGSPNWPSSAPAWRSPSLPTSPPPCSRNSAGGRCGQRSWPDHRSRRSAGSPSCSRCSTAAPVPPWTPPRACSSAAPRARRASGTCSPARDQASAAAAARSPAGSSRCASSTGRSRRRPPVISSPRPWPSHASSPPRSRACGCFPCSASRRWRRPGTASAS